VPVDLTESSRLVLEWALVLAQRLGAKITLHYVPDLLAETPSADARRRDPERTQVQKPVEWQLAQWGRSCAGVPVEVDLLPVTGGPDAKFVERIVKRAATDLIVIGWRRCSCWQRLLRNHVAERLLRAAPCPVLNVPESAWGTLAAAGDPCETTPNASSPSAKARVTPDPGYLPTAARNTSAKDRQRKESTHCIVKS
jgi:nucleotide-binding universal stress UspA family protein